MMDPYLQEFLRRAAFAGAGPSIGSTFAPSPIMFKAPQYGQQQGVAPTGVGNVVSVMPGFDAVNYYGGADADVSQATAGAPISFGPIDNQITNITDFQGVPMTEADLIGMATNIAVPSLFNLASLALTGQTIGQQVKGQLTPVENASSVPAQGSFDLGTLSGYGGAGDVGPADMSDASGGVTGPGMGVE